MNILLLGSGGREHALAWKMRQSALCKKLFIAPGNAGTAQLGENIHIGVNDFEQQKQFCIEHSIDLIVVGPEEPLVNGVYDFFNNQNDWKGFVVAPSKQGAQLEGSKAFSKKFMQRHRIPTAAYAEFDQNNFEEGKKYLLRHSLPIVLKADGLAAGKGVVIAFSHEEALRVFEEMLIHKQFGEASEKVVVEEFLSGIELSVFVLTDGKNYKIIGCAKDYKRIGEGDTGLNTGGMGAVAPLPFVDKLFMQKIEDSIIRPTINGLAQENIDYKGFIFFGLIKVNGEPFVIEYNCRMGDPETEVVMPCLKNDLVQLFVSLRNGTLAEEKIEIEHRVCAAVVAVSGGYPNNYEKGKIISLPKTIPNDSFIFHAGTKMQNGNLVTDGGRVLAVTSLGKNMNEAVQQSKNILQQISFEGMNYRKDIGYEFA